jgi:heme-degrading monooxygenase HmoA
MIHILAKVSIEDLPEFISVFSTRGAEMRRKHGSRNSQIFTVPEQSNQVVVLFEWDSKEVFEGFLNDPVVKETMQSSGTVGRPEFTILEKLAELPG